MGYGDTTSVLVDLAPLVLALGLRSRGKLRYAEVHWAKTFREEYVRRRARELAESGRFERWQGIEFELRLVEGVREAGVWLGSEPLREELDILCRQAKSRRPASTAKKPPA